MTENMFLHRLTQLDEARKQRDRLNALIEELKLEAALALSVYELGEVIDMPTFPYKGRQVRITHIGIIGTLTLRFTGTVLRKDGTESHQIATWSSNQDRNAETHANNILQRIRDLKANDKG